MTLGKNVQRFPMNHRTWSQTSNCRDDGSYNGCFPGCKNQEIHVDFQKIKGGAVSRSKQTVLSIYSFIFDPGDGLRCFRFGKHFWWRHVWDIHFKKCNPGWWWNMIRIRFWNCSKNPWMTMASKRSQICCRSSTILTYVRAVMMYVTFQQNSVTFFDLFSEVLFLNWTRPFKKPLKE